MIGEPYQVLGKDGIYIIVREASGDVVGVFYAEDERGWWQGAAWGRRRRFYLPDVEPADVGLRFLRPQ